MAFEKTQNPPKKINLRISVDNASSDSHDISPSELSIDAYSENLVLTEEYAS